MKKILCLLCVLMFQSPLIFAESPKTPRRSIIENLAAVKRRLSGGLGFMRA